MAEFRNSSLWHISEFERQRLGASQNGALEGRNTMLPTSLLGDLGRIERSPWRGDVLEVMAACLRQREAALVYLGHAGRVLPVTLFPREWLYHCPRDMLEVLVRGARDLTVLSVEPPSMRPPGHWQQDRVTELARYRPLGPMVWALALQGPRHALLTDLAPPAAFRITAEFHLGSLPTPGALGPALRRLRTQIASQRTLAGWPGMNTERACRLLNALYLQRGLMVLRSAQAAGEGGGWFSRWRERFKRSTPPGRH